MLSVRLELIPSSNSTFLTLGAKSSKMSIFACQSNSALISNLNFTRQHESKGMLDLQNRAPYVKLQFYVNRDNDVYLEKWDFQRKLVCQLWDRH